MQITSQIGGGGREQRKRPEETPRKMSGAPELERSNACDENVENERSRFNESRRESAKGHHGDVTGGARVADRGVKESDERHAAKEENKVRLIEIHKGNVARASGMRRLQSTSWKLALQFP